MAGTYEICEAVCVVDDEDNVKRSLSSELIDEFDEYDLINKDVDELAGCKSIILILFVTVCIFAVKFRSSSIQNIFKLSHEGLQRSSDNIFSNSIQLSVTNEYSSKNYTMFSYPFLDSSLLLEPHRANNLSITGIEQSCLYSWVLVGIDLISDSNFSGSVDQTTDSFVIDDITATGQYSLSITQTCSDITSEIVSQSVWVKYVRRELQSLTDEDREEYLDALFTLWTVNTVDGQALYGPGYKSLHYFAAIHNDAGGNSVCDEFHANSGFLNNHVFLGMYLEQSLQLVNPRVCLHYMEYTKYFSSISFQEHLDNMMDGGAWTELLSEKYFGSNDPVTGRLLDGRWASSNYSVPYMDDDFFSNEAINQSQTWFPEEQQLWLESTAAHLNSPYGLLRSPWNYNPSTYIIRYHNVDRIANTSEVDLTSLQPYMGATCGDLADFIDDLIKMPSLSQYLETCEDMIHANMHYTFGGAGGDHAVEVDSKLLSEFGLTRSEIVDLTTAAQVFFRQYIRFADNTSDFVSPINCTADPWDGDSTSSSLLDWPATTNGPSCTCSSFYLDSEDNIDELIDMFYGTVPKLAMLDDMGYSVKYDIMSLICSRFQIEGDMAGSGAPLDPLFWVAHGSVERLFQRIVFEGVLEDMTYKESNRYHHTWGSTCSGHEADGTKQWLEGFSFSDPEIDPTSLTNEYLAAMLDPTSDLYRDNIPFVYEDSGWSWCDGFDSLFS